MSTTMTSQQFAEFENFMHENPDIDTIEVLVTDLNGILRGKWLPRKHLQRVLEGNFKMPLSAVTADIWGRDVASLCAQTGDGDGICRPVAGSLKRIPWLSSPTAQLLLKMSTEDGDPWGCDPRVVLERVVDRYRARGWRAVTAAELEFYLFLERADHCGAPQLPVTRSNGHCQIGGQIFNTDTMHEYADLLHAIRTACRDMEVPLDTIVKELSPAQFELNLQHVDDPLVAADNTQWLKRTIKNIAQQHGYIASFMAKPLAHLDGNGLHVHASIVDTNGHNLFDDGTPEGSQILRNAVAGLQQTMAETFLLYAPHINSYRRFKSGSHAPVAPTWGYENRDVALRIPNGDHNARRIECRVAGADANPYLTLATILASMLWGIEHQRQPSEPQTAGYTEQKPSLPRHWFEALQNFEQSTRIGAMLGEDFQRAYGAIKQAEQHEFEGLISAMEHDTYLVLS